MNFYRRWIEKKEEEGFEEHARIKKKHAFDWGLNHLGLNELNSDPRQSLNEYTHRHLADSASYFVPKRLSSGDYTLEENQLSFPSAIHSFDKNNNVAYCKYFPTSKRDNIIIVVPHWNAPVEKYDRVCRFMNKMNWASIRVTLPYHDIRDPEGEENSTLMVSANIGLTLQAMQQCVQDIISTVNWLEYRGYKKIGIMGASIGSCAAYLAAVHEPRINGFFANLMSSYFGDVVWTGRSTRHIRSSVEPHLTQEELREFWMLNSPIAFVDKIHKYNPKLKQFIMSARYDTTFLYYLTEIMFDGYKQNSVRFESAVLPCGHYTLGKYWFKWIDGYYMVKFFRSLFKIQHYPNVSLDVEQQNSMENEYK